MTAPVIICRAPSTVFRRYMECPSCKLRSRAVIDDHGWWGFERICCNCGCLVEDGYIRRQSYRRRQESLRRAKRLWRDAPPRVEARRLFMEAIG